MKNPFAILLTTALVAGACDSGQHRGLAGERCATDDDCGAGLICRLTDLSGVCAASSGGDAGADAPPPVVGGTGGTNPMGTPDAQSPLELARAISGCGDGEREALTDLTRYPNVAACSGGWWKGGIAQNWPPMCGRRAGDDAEGDLQTGRVCAANDLCADGWHICRTGDEMITRGLATCAEIPAPAAADDTEALFFASAQPGFDALTGGGTTCYANNVGSNNVFGCAIGNIAAPVTNASCEPYGFRMLVFREGQPFDCGLYSPWDCGTSLTEKQELEAVTKYGPSRGGVLCCRNDLVPQDGGAAP